MLKEVRHVLHVRVQAAPVRLEPVELAAHAAVLDGASGHANLCRYFIQGEGHAAVLLSEEQDAP
jgi:hypothetical protein